MICNNCGNNVAPGLSHCDVCGADLSMNVNPNIPYADPGKTTGLVSLILGISSLVLNFSCCFSAIPVVGQIISTLSFLALPSAIAAFITGLIGNSKSKAAGFSNGKAKAGILTSIFGIVVGIISFIFALIVLIFGIGALGAMMSGEM